MDIEILRTICKQLPAVTEDIKWGHDLCFSVANKIFCVTGLEAPLKISFKVKDEEFEELSRTRDIIPAPYLARYKWVLVEKPDRFTRKEWKHYIKQSYEIVRSRLPKKALQDFGLL
jgi:predicted DNA-binding protein (MmcQ/YjbR family)